MRKVLIGLALVLAFAGPVAAADELPFKGNLSGSVTVTPIASPLVSALIQGGGTATMLGRYTVEVDHIVNQATRVGVGTYVFTAANGDTLTATFSGQATLVAPGVLTVAETGTFIGGTGRFAGATGGFTASRVFTVATATTTGTFEGSISLP